MPGARKSLQERFWEKVRIPEDRSGCWEWTGAKANFGYGVIGLGSRKDGIKRAHILSWEWANGHVKPEGMVLCHQCDNPACVNPAHLHVATQKENLREAVERKRGLGKGKVPWTKNKMAKLDPEAVIKIRELARSGMTQRAIAKEFGLKSHHSIGSILVGETWTHVKEAPNVT